MFRYRMDIQCLRPYVSGCHHLMQDSHSVCGPGSQQRVPSHPCPKYDRCAVCGLRVTRARMSLCSCSGCPSSSGGRTYSYSFSQKMPAINYAVVPAVFPHQSSFDVNSVLKELPMFYDPCPCPTITEVKMRVRFLYEPAAVEPPILAIAHFIDQNQKGRRGERVFPPCTVGFNDRFAARGTDVSQPFNTVFTAYHRETNRIRPDYLVLVYFTTMAGGNLPVFARLSDFVFDFQVCFEDTVQCDESGVV